MHVNGSGTARNAVFSAFAEGCGGVLIMHPENKRAQRGGGLLAGRIIPEDVYGYGATH